MGFKTLALVRVASWMAGIKYDAKRVREKKRETFNLLATSMEQLFSLELERSAVPVSRHSERPSRGRTSGWLDCLVAEIITSFARLTYGHRLDRRRQTTLSGQQQ